MHCALPLWMVRVCHCAVWQVPVNWPAPAVEGGKGNSPLLTLGRQLCCSLQSVPRVHKLRARVDLVCNVTCDCVV